MEILIFVAYIGMIAVMLGIFYEDIKHDRETVLVMAALWPLTCCFCLGVYLSDRRTMRRRRSPKDVERNRNG